MENQWAGGIKKFLGWLVTQAWRTQLELKWQSYDRVGRVVHGVVTQFKSVIGVKLS